MLASQVPGKATNVLVIGSGGREHALAWKLLQSPQTEKLYVAPGNGGTKDFNVPIAATEIRKLQEFATEKRCFTVVGPEAPLEAGIVDKFHAKGLPIFGPTAEEAKLETSKAYAKEFLKNHYIPTADFQIFDEAERAIDYAALNEGNVVVKVDGLAAGKGVYVCSTLGEAEAAIRLILEKKAFGKAGGRIVIEKKLRGQEASFLFLCDGKSAFDFGTAVDHKRALDGDKGPNTGGMGAYSPAPQLLTDQVAEVRDRIVTPAIKFLGFCGFLYVGLMFDDTSSPKVLEFNARLGDPEAQAILPRLDSDLLLALVNVGKEEIRATDLSWKDSSSCTVVMCSEGYPENPKIGDAIRGIPEAEASPNVIVFHSGTLVRNSSLFTNGGRVLSVTGIGTTKKEAAKKAYEAVSLISWRGERHRTDIASQ